ncbi:MAG TPA: site-specific integrase [Pirellulales bacterium]|jgi:integrase|nr:site-specific integrase [Pirellulales bacterium]
MPRSAGESVPSYRKHRASGQAIVVIAGRCHYLGPHGTVASRAEYDRLIAEWIANGRQLSVAPDLGLTIAELMQRYRQHVQQYYVKNGRATSEQHDIASAMRFVRTLYAEKRVGEFGPLSLKAVRQKMLDAGWARSTINRQVQRVQRMFRWGVENELVSASVYQALKAVNGLRKGRCPAREPLPIGPVSDATVEATLEMLPKVVADMVRFQRLTGCRPQDVCSVRPCDIDTSGDVWVFVPIEHKTEHHGRQHSILIGPKAQSVLRPYLLRESTSFCFRPSDSERKRRAANEEARVTPLQYGNRSGTNRKSRPKRTAGDRYNTSGYRRCISRTVERINEQRKSQADEQIELIENWSPNRLRHTAATKIRKRFGLEAAQVVLGHSAADVTQVYAERDLTKAAAVMREVG